MVRRLQILKNNGLVGNFNNNTLWSCLVQPVLNLSSVMCSAIPFSCQDLVNFGIELIEMSVLLIFTHSGHSSLSAYFFDSM